MKSLKLTLAVGLTAASSVALALPSFVGVFNTTYKPGPNLKKETCGVCHIGKSPKLNPYGLDMKKALEEAKTKKLTPETLKKLDGMDSDKDGVKNAAEIKGDTLPGDPKSKPAE